MRWLLLLLLTACNFRPFYERPLPPCMPSSWREESPFDPDTVANVCFWKQFNDPILDELIQCALKNNQDLQAATARICQFYSLFRIVWAQNFPEISGLSSYTREELPLDEETIDTKKFDSVYTLELFLTYEIDLWGRVHNLSEAAFSEFLSSVENRRNVILTLVANVARSYILLRQLDEQLAISKKTFQDRENSVKLAKKRFEGGLTTELVVKQAEADKIDVQVEVVRFERLIPQQENLLSLLIGECSSPICRGLTLKELLLPATVPCNIPSEVLQNRPDIMAAEEKLKAANANVGVARALFYPQISLSALFGVQSLSLSHLFNRSSQMWNYTLTAIQPLFTAGRLNANLELSYCLKEEAIHHYLQTILVAFREANDALIGQVKARELVEVQENKVAVQEAYLRLATLQYLNGETDYIAVLDASRDHFRAQLELASARADLFLTLIDIYKALGGGWVIEAEKIVDCY